jgi:hypothetical protein
MLVSVDRGRRLFIARASADGNFRSGLLDKLRVGLDGWVVWPDLEEHHQWIAEAQYRITNSDAFCFVVSHKSLDSGPCRLELDYAVSPAVDRPVLRIDSEPVDDERLWPTLRSVDPIRAYEMTNADVVEACRNRLEDLIAQRLVIRRRSKPTSS